MYYGDYIRMTLRRLSDVPMEIINRIVDDVVGAVRLASISLQDSANLFHYGNWGLITHQRGGSNRTANITLSSGPPLLSWNSGSGAVRSSVWGPNHHTIHSNSARSGYSSNMSIASSGDLHGVNRFQTALLGVLQGRRANLMYLR